MARYESPERLAAKMRKWADAGFDYAIIAGARTALEEDRRDSISRAPSRSGALRRTIRVTTPSSRRAARTGIVRIGLSAGSRVFGNPVRYAAVHQRGLVGYPPKPKTKPHVIEAHAAGTWIARWSPRHGYSARQASGKVLSFLVAGRRAFARHVNHPGSRFRALEYLKVNETRAAGAIDQSVQKSADAEL
jgi:hypothetical protein